jgi:hypothetical protein
MLFHAFRCVAMLFDTMLCSSPRLSMAYQGQGKTLKDTGHLRKGRVITGVSNGLTSGTHQLAI